MSRAVIDQSGFRVVIIGLALSVFLGLALRSQISETRIQTYLNKSVDRLQADFFVDYDSAKVNLSSWGMPLPALVIKNIRLSPKATLCQSSQIFISELEVPVSLSMIIGINRIVPKIRAKEIELRLSDVDRCMGAQNEAAARRSNIQEIAVSGSGNQISSSKDFSIAQVPKAEPGVKNIFSNKTRAELKEVYVEKLKIILSKKPDQPVLFKQMNIELFYTENRLSEVHLKSKLNALKDARSDVYFLNANLTSIFKAKENNEIETIANFDGKLLDGDVQLFMHNFTGSKKISYELGVEHVSVKALYPFFEGTESDKNINIEKTPISVSFANHGEIYLTGKTSVDSKFKKVQLNVENGSLKVSEIEINYDGSQLSLKPFDLAIESLSLSKIKNIEGLRKKLDSFDSLGDLTGKLEFKNENSYEIKGSIKNIQAVFSNRGRRDLQGIDHVDVEVERSGANLKIGAKNFVINGQKLNGAFEAVHDLNKLSTVAQLKLDGSSMNSKVWEQFTFVEQSPKFSILWNYKKSGNESHKINIFVDKIGLPGVRLDSLNIDINQTLGSNANDNSLNVFIKPNRLMASQTFLENKTVQQVFNPQNGFKMTMLNSYKSHLSITGKDWKNVSFNMDTSFLSDANSKSETYLNLKGSVKYEVGLEAHLVLQNKNSHLKFDLSSKPEEEIVVKSLQ
ncbi:hypothetical protein K2P97_03365 [bacterium]|nr:hypothetical protein [bacterium]